MTARQAAALYRDWLDRHPADPLGHAVYFNYGVLLSGLDDLPGAATASGAVVVTADPSDPVRGTVRVDATATDAKGTLRLGNAVFVDTGAAESFPADLRAAIGNKGLRVVYQPIVSIETMQIAGCEALCRWDQSSPGCHPPHPP